MAVAPPEKILKELADLWVTTGKQEAGEAAHGVLRACSMTLIVITEDREDPADLGETIAALMPEHPARTIVVRLTGEGERSIAQRVFAQCWMPFGQRRQICCEQVEIVCSDASLGDVPSVVLPLEVPDLPVILWCRSPRLLGMAEFPALAAVARRVVVDSGAMADAPAALRRLANETARGRLLGDLAWTRLTRWRQTLAQIFEDPRHAARLTGAARITVCDGGAVTTQALYMGTWMAGALASAGVGATAQISTKTQQTSAELDCGDFHARLERQDGHLAATVDGVSQCTVLPQPDDYLLLREELGIVQRDPVFEKTLASA
ncbi:MAG: glucose-6-phosphate dehydrogenase assembly protein OpcA, partial [Bryobacteraceae bacterium]